jgi:hypothetical protein
VFLYKATKTIRIPSLTAGESLTAMSARVTKRLAVGYKAEISLAKVLISSKVLESSRLTTPSDCNKDTTALITLYKWVKWDHSLSSRNRIPTGSESSAEFYDSSPPVPWDQDHLEALH